MLLPKRGFYHPVAILVLAAITISFSVIFYLNSTVFFKAPDSTQSTTQSPNLPLSHADTTNWETYTNSRFKYKFSYPSDYEIVSLEWVDLTPTMLEKWAIAVQKGDQMVMSLSSIDFEINPGDRVENTEALINKLKESGKPSTTYTETTVDNEKAYLVDTVSTKPYITFIRNNVKFEINMLNEDANQILSTFKFTD